MPLNGVGVHIVARNDSCEPFASTFAQIKPQVIVQWACAIGTPSVGNEGADLFHGLCIHMSFDFQRWHAVRVPSEVWESREHQQVEPPASHP